MDKGDKLLSGMRVQRTVVRRIAVTFVLALSWSMAMGSIDGDISFAASSPSFCQGASAKDVDPNLVSSQDGVSLAVSRKRVDAGAAIYARLVNFSSKSAGYGREFVIQRYGSSGWSIDPSSPEGPWPRSLSKLPMGAAGRCFKFQVPMEQPEGRYRFSTKIFLESGASARRSVEFVVR
jgi:hypothetical protein